MAQHPSRSRDTLLVGLRAGPQTKLAKRPRTYPRNGSVVHINSVDLLRLLRHASFDRPKPTAGTLWEFREFWPLISVTQG